MLTWFRTRWLWTLGIVLAAVALLILLPSAYQTYTRERMVGVQHITRLDQERSLSGSPLPASLEMRSVQYLHPDDASRIVVSIPLSKRPSKSVGTGPEWFALDQPTITQPTIKRSCSLTLPGFDSARLQQSSYELFDFTDLYLVLRTGSRICQWAIAPQRSGHHIGIAAVTLVQDSGTKKGRRTYTASYSGIVDIDVTDPPFSPEKMLTYVGIFGGLGSLVSLIVTFRKN